MPPRMPNAALNLFLLCIPALCFAQVLPALPDIPSVLPTPSAAATPSESMPVAILLSSPSPSASASPPLAVAQLPGATSTPAASVTPSPSGSVSPLPAELLPPEGAFDAAESPAVVPGRCVRNPAVVAPTLGTSQLLYALAVVGGAAAVALASLIYSAAAEWEIEEEHEGLRLSGIFVARLLIIFAVKVSAALVAAISNGSPEDGALDASGAFLTWASAILTRVYYEAFQMTLRAIGFFANTTSWDEDLRTFLSPLKEESESFDCAAGAQEAGFAPRPVAPESAELEEEDAGVPASPPGSGNGSLRNRCLAGRKKSIEKMSLGKRLLAGRIDRRLLVVHGMLYIIAEVSTLVINLANLMGRLSRKSERTPFVPMEDAGQCGITKQDGPFFAGLIMTQVVYLISQQQSLIPVLTIAASSSTGKGAGGFLSRIRKLRWLVLGVFIVWLASLFSLPMFSDELTSLFLVGDVSLFWMVLLGPPKYTEAGFAVSATYAVLTSIIGWLIMYNIREAAAKRT